MISRKQFLYNAALVGAGLLASPLGATGTNATLTAREAAAFDAVIEQMNQGHSSEQLSYGRTLHPKKIISRVETEKGYKTTFRTVNGSLVVLEDFGRPVTRFYS